MTLPLMTSKRIPLNPNPKRMYCAATWVLANRERGRDAHYWAPPAQIRTCPIKAFGSHLGLMTARQWALRLRRSVHGQSALTHRSVALSPPCVQSVHASLGPRPWLHPLRRPLGHPCSQASQLLWRVLTSPARASSATAFHLPDAGHQAIQRPMVRLEISRFPFKELAHMPGSTTAPSLQGTRDVAPYHVAFHRHKGMGTRDDVNFAAQWLAYALPCQRFALPLAGHCA